jgi:hypothetical protein
MESIMAKLTAIEEELQLYGITRQFHRQHHRYEWKLICRGQSCRAEMILHWNDGMQPGSMIRDAMTAGWLMGRGERPLCPECQHALSVKATELAAPKPKNWIVPRNPGDRLIPKKEEPPMEQTLTNPTDMNGIEGVAITAAAGMPAAPSAKIARGVHELLGEFFDERTGIYLRGYSDEQIATQVGCHVGIVQRVRIEAYGELTEDVRLSALRADIDAVVKGLT